ncbi:hypothetical protein OROMI_003317 [Orobanche minor]
MSASTVEPQDKMRGRDVNKVARGEQAPRPPQRTPDVSRAPPPSSTSTPKQSEEAEGKKESASHSHQRQRRCYDTYYEYHRCIEEKGAEAEACKKVADYYKSTCPDWIVGRWRVQ